MPDLTFHNHGSIVLIEPTSETGQEWLDENVQSESWQWLGHALASERGHALACEPRLAMDVAEGAASDGLTIA